MVDCQKPCTTYSEVSRKKLHKTAHIRSCDFRQSNAREVTSSRIQQRRLVVVLSGGRETSTKEGRRLRVVPWAKC